MEEASRIERPGDYENRCDEDYDVPKVRVAGPAGENHPASECAN